MQTVNIGLVGASWFADLWYLPALSKHPSVQLAAICSKAGDSARKMAGKYGIPSVYTSYLDMMDKETLDGICIVTPNDLHFPVAMAAMERGIHVLCEKPLALNGEETAQMLRKAEEKRIVHGVNFTYREHPGVREMKRRVQEGQIGRVLEGRFEYSGDYGLSGPPGWRGSVRQAGIGGVLQDLGSHLIDMAQHIIGEPIVEVQSSVRFLENGGLVDFHSRTMPDQAADSIYFNAAFRSGAHGVFQTSWVSPQGNSGQTIALEIHGTKGSLRFLSGHLGSRLLYTAAGSGGAVWKEASLPDMPEWDIAAEPAEARFRPYRVSPANEAWKWVDAIVAAKEGNAPSVDRPGFREGHRVQRVIDAIIRSADEKRTIAVEQDG